MSFSDFNRAGLTVNHAMEFNILAPKYFKEVVLFHDGKRLILDATVVCLLPSHALCLDKYETMKILFSIIINFLPSGSFTKSPHKAFIPENGRDKQNFFFTVQQKRKLGLKLLPPLTFILTSFDMKTNVRLCNDPP